LSEDRKSFGVRLRVEGGLPIGEDAFATLDLVVHGAFASEAPVADVEFEAFTEHTPLVMLWPYARSYFADLGRMMGVTLPPLPTLDASAPTDEEAEPEAPSAG
jgi:hypothetical protein